MKPDTRKIIDEAMKLDPPARAMIAEPLLDSLDVGADFEISEAWRKEIRRRCSEIDDGSVALIPGERVLDELWAKYGS